MKSYIKIEKLENGFIVTGKNDVDTGELRKRVKSSSAFLFIGIYDWDDDPEVEFTSDCLRQIADALDEKFGKKK